jgi:hypothetical protein
MEFRIASGSTFSRTMSETMSLPPSLNTRNAPAKTPFLSGETLITQF